MIPASELAAIQAEAARVACDLSCTIERLTRTPESQGGATVGYSNVVTVNAGMAQPTAGQLQNYEYIIGSLAAWQVKFPIGTDVRHGDLLSIAGQALKVQVILNPRSYPALLTVLATEVK